MSVVSVMKEAFQTSLYKVFLACARDLDIAAQTGPSLVIAPHPDDESLGCGATIARLRSLGQRVRIVIVTDGAACGNSAVLTRKDIAAIRRQESIDAASVLGVPQDDVVLLQFPDKGTEERADEVEAALEEQIRKFGPHRIFSPYGVDAHPDHRVTAAAVERLYRKNSISCPVYDYPIWFTTIQQLGHLAQPQKMMRLRRVPTENFLAAKQAAIAAHRSQNVAPTDEGDWFTLPDKFLRKFLISFEIFFEK